MVKVRDAKPEELAPKPRKPRALTPRQLAIKKRKCQHREIYTV